MSDKYQEHLRRQLGFLHRSCSDYDSGHLDEAIRIATIARVLIHHTPKSTSLLTHLNATTIKLLTTSRPVRPGTLMHDGVSLIAASAKVEVRPKLGNSSFQDFIPVSDWWEQIIIVFGSLNVSRKRTILTAANKDGGAHVDDKLTPEYEDLVAGLWNRTSPDPERSGMLRGVHFIALRQIGYELMNSPELLSLAIL